MADKMKKLAQDALLVVVGIQHDGGVYQLDPLSERRIEEAFPGANILPVVVLGHRNESEFERTHRRHWEDVAKLLTGLTPEQITQLGGVRIYDPEGNRVVWQWKPPPVTR
jgi:hypothetical protein